MSVPGKKGGGSAKERLDAAVARARSAREARERGYRERALRMYPWVCGRCQREFTEANVRELTVHHRDHDHDNNPEDGSNWELLCVYCHDNEHRRLLDGEYGDLGGGEAGTGAGPGASAGATQRPFAGLADLLRKGNDPGSDGM